MKPNTLVLKCISDLLPENFFIPDYQRGYRWGKLQVLDLLEDIWSFRMENHDSRREVFYCLQPIVVSRNQGDTQWIVIDGQQRLTTLHLILTYLDPYLGRREPKKFDLSYQTRPDSGVFLAAPSEEDAFANPDYYHIYQAYQTISEWFEAKGGNTELNFIQTLLNSDEEGKNVKVIWYDVPSGDTEHHIDIFTRLNIGKIPLTNAELIKAQLLNQGNFDSGRAQLRQIQIASEWDQMERRLHQADFWYFIYDPSHPFSYENRMEYLFDMMYNRTRESEANFTFLEFLKSFEDSKTDSGSPNVDVLWRSIKNYFLSFEDWYQNPELYHLIGFLVTCGVDIRSLHTASLGKDKQVFMAHLRTQVRQQLPHHIQSLEYGTAKTNRLIKQVLLLFNIQTLMNNKGADLRFPFHHYKNKGNWDLEHIRSQTEKSIKSDRNRKAWLQDILNYFTGHSSSAFTSENGLALISEAGLQEDQHELCIALFNAWNQVEVDKDAFNTLRIQVEKRFKERSENGQSTIDSIHSIGNLTLLDEETNRSYQNAAFPIKRKRILQNDATGQFVPIATKNVFLKYYSKQMGEVMYWSAQDARDYEDAILKTLAPFLPKTQS